MAMHELQQKLCWILRLAPQKKKKKKELLYSWFLTFTCMTGDAYWLHGRLWLQFIQDSSITNNLSSLSPSLTQAATRYLNASDKRPVAQN